MPEIIIPENSIHWYALLPQFNLHSSVMQPLPQNSTENLVFKNLSTSNFITFHKFWKLSYVLAWTLHLSPTWKQLVTLLNSFLEKWHHHTYCHCYLNYCNCAISRLTIISNSSFPESNHFAMAVLKMSDLCFQSFNSTHQWSQPSLSILNHSSPIHSMFLLSQTPLTPRGAAMLSAFMSSHGELYSPYL